MDIRKRDAYNWQTIAKMPELKAEEGATSGAALLRNAVGLDKMRNLCYYCDKTNIQGRRSVESRAAGERLGVVPLRPFVFTEMRGEKMLKTRHVHFVMTPVEWAALNAVAEHEASQPAETLRQLVRDAAKERGIWQPLVERVVQRQPARQ